MEQDRRHRPSGSSRASAPTSTRGEGVRGTRALRDSAGMWGIDRRRGSARPPSSVVTGRAVRRRQRYRCQSDSRGRSWPGRSRRLEALPANAQSLRVPTAAAVAPRQRRGSGPRQSARSGRRSASCPVSRPVRAPLRATTPRAGDDLGPAGGSRCRATQSEARRRARPFRESIRFGPAESAVASLPCRAPSPRMDVGALALDDPDGRCRRSCSTETFGSLQSRRVSPGTTRPVRSADPGAQRLLADRALTGQ